MEVKINREVMNYSESIFFGLSLRQFICTVLSGITAIVIYFSFKNVLGLETTSWLCIIAAAPFIGLGFIKYNGMTMEELVIAWFKSEVLVPKELYFVANNIYFDILQHCIKN